MKKHTLSEGGSIPIFVINLLKDEQKKQHMQNQAKKHNLQMQFIEAVYGKDLDESVVDRVCNHDESIKLIKRKLFRGEVGVAMSQMHIYQKMIDENIQQAIIFEDDAQIYTGINEVIDSISKFPDDWELVMLGYYRHFAKNKFHRISFRGKKQISKHYKLVRFTEVMHGAHGYIINIKGARRLLEVLSKGVVEPVDHYTGDQKYINLYGISPQCVGTDDSLPSTIVEERIAHLTPEYQKKDNSFKGKLKQKLDQVGMLKYILKANYIRVLILDELKHLKNRLKVPTRY